MARRLDIVSLILALKCVMGPVQAEVPRASPRAAPERTREQSLPSSLNAAAIVEPDPEGARERRRSPGEESPAIEELAQKVAGGLEASLLDIYRVALNRDTLFRASRYERQASHAAWLLARAGLLPTAGVGFERRQIDQRITQSANPLFTTGNRQFPTESLILEVSQSLYDPSKFIRWKQAKTEESMAEAQVEAAHQDLIIRVSHAYLNALSARRLVHYRELALADLSKQKSLVDRRYAQKLVPVTDRDVTRSRWELARADLTRANEGYVSSLLELEEICGTPVRNIAPMREDIPMVPPSPAKLDFWLEKSRSQNALLKAFEFDALGKKLEVHRVRSTQMPTVALVSRYDQQFTGGTVFGGGNEVVNQEVLVRMKVPIFEGGLTHYRIRQAHFEQLSRQEALEQVARRTRRETETAFRRVQSAIEQGRALRDAIESQERVVASTVESYEGGLVAGVMVLDAQRDLYNARHRYEDCRNEYVLAGLLLNQSAGTLDGMHLQIVNQWLVNPAAAEATPFAH